MSRRLARAAVAALVDPHHGVFTDMTTFRTREVDGAWWISAVTLARTPVGSLFRPDAIGAAGTSADYDEAVQRASGEAIERYSALNFDPPRTPLTLRESGAARFLPRCAPFEPCGPELKDHPLDVPISHVPVTSLTAGGEVMVPASLVFLEASFLRGEVFLTHPISTGLAFAADAATAVWRGFCEVVERDALMHTWWSRRRVTRIGTASDELPWSLRRRLGMIGRSPVSVVLYDMTTDVGLPTALAVATSPVYPHRMVAAACRDGLAAACTKALDEIFSLRSVLQHGERPEPPADPFHILQLEQHATYYAGGDNDEAFAFLDAVPEASFAELDAARSSPAPASWAEVVARLRALEPLGIEVCWADVTAPEFCELGTVAKVIATDLLPLSAPHAARWLGMPRAARALQISGETEFNPWPHPFA